MTTGISYDDSPAVLLVTDGPRIASRFNEAAAAMACRVAGSVDLAEAPARLAQQADCAAIVLALDRDSQGSTDAALAALADWMAGRDTPLIAGIASNLIDPVAAALPDAAILCEPDVVECAGVLSLALGPRRARLSDIGVEPEAARLRRLTEEVARIARQLGALTDAQAPAPRRGFADAGVGFRTEPAPQAALEPDLALAARVRAIIRNRRARAQYFTEELFADPAWDMLLDLMAARLEGVKVAVSSLCIAAAVPPTTALRWISTMSEHGLFVRIADPRDGRRVFVELSDRAAMAMSDYLATTVGDEI